MWISHIEFLPATLTTIMRKENGMECLTREQKKTVWTHVKQQMTNSNIIHIISGRVFAATCFCNHLETVQINAKNFHFSHGWILPLYGAISIIPFWHKVKKWVSDNRIIVEKCDRRCDFVASANHIDGFKKSKSIFGYTSWVSNRPMLHCKE